MARFDDIGVTLGTYSQPGVSVTEYIQAKAFDIDLDTCVLAAILNELHRTSRVMRENAITQLKILQELKLLNKNNLQRVEYQLPADVLEATPPIDVPYPSYEQLHRVGLGQRAQSVLRRSGYTKWEQLYPANLLLVKHCGKVTCDTIMEWKLSYWKAYVLLRQTESALSPAPLPADPTPPVEPLPTAEQPPAEQPPAEESPPAIMLNP